VLDIVPELFKLLMANRVQIPSGPEMVPILLSVTIVEAAAFSIPADPDELVMIPALVRESMVPVL